MTKPDLEDLFFAAGTALSISGICLAMWIFYYFTSGVWGACAICVLGGGGCVVVAFRSTLANLVSGSWDYVDRIRQRRSN